MMLVSPGVNTGFRTCLAVTPTSCKLPDIVTTNLAPGNECHHVPPGKQIRLDFLKGYRLVGGWATRPKQQLYIAYVCMYSKNIYKCIHICMYIYICVYMYLYTPTYTTHNTHIHMYTYVTYVTYVCIYIYYVYEIGLVYHPLEPATPPSHHSGRWNHSWLCVSGRSPLRWLIGFW